MRTDCVGRAEQSLHAMEAPQASAVAEEDTSGSARAALKTACLLPVLSIGPHTQTPAPETLVSPWGSRAAVEGNLVAVYVMQLLYERPGGCCHDFVVAVDLA